MAVYTIPAGYTPTNSYANPPAPAFVAAAAAARQSGTGDAEGSSTQQQQGDGGDGYACADVQPHNADSWSTSSSAELEQRWGVHAFVSKGGCSTSDGGSDKSGSTGGTACIKLSSTGGNAVQSGGDSRAAEDQIITPPVTPPAAAAAVLPHPSPFGPAINSCGTSDAACAAGAVASTSVGGLLQLLPAACGGLHGAAFDNNCHCTDAAMGGDGGCGSNGGIVCVSAAAADCGSVGDSGPCSWTSVDARSSCSRSSSMGLSLTSSDDVDDDVEWQCSLRRSSSVQSSSGQHVCRICGAVGHAARACTAPYCCLCDRFNHPSSR